VALLLVVRKNNFMLFEVVVRNSGESSDDWYKRCIPAANDFVRMSSSWFCEHLKITDKQTDTLVPFVCNTQQLDFLFHIGMQLAQGYPVRVIVLKCRQIGFSTVITALGFMLTYLLPYYPAFTCAHDADGTQTLWEMMKRFRENLPASMCRPMDNVNLREIIYSSPHGSTFRFHTAGTEGLARTKKNTFVHISEAAWIKNWLAVSGGLLNTVSEKNPMSMIFTESTANGTSGAYHTNWNNAVSAHRGNESDLNHTIPLFYSWLDFEEYRMVLPIDYDFGVYDDEEVFLQSLGADDEQLYFRRKVIADKLSGDESLFKQEFPASPAQAFRSSGSPAIPHAIIAYHEKCSCEPVRKVVFRRDDKGKVLVSDAPESPMAWWIWEEPLEDADYSLGGDVSEGLLSDVNNAASKVDLSTGAVLNRRSMRFVATWAGSIDPDIHGEQLRMVAEWYNTAWGSPEINTCGQACVPAWRDYEKFYQRQMPVDSLKAGKVLPLYGWKTTMSNRNHLIDDWLAYCRPDADRGFEGQIVVYDKRVAFEESTFILKKSGKREHESGKHDDLLFACFIALQVHLRMPREFKPLVKGYKYDGPSVDRTGMLSGTDTVAQAMGSTRTAVQTEID
jgi:hypothetical protein